MEVVGNLAAGIAHDLNNILSGLVSYPDLILREIAPDDPLYSKIEIIQKSGKKAASIVHDLLSLARRNLNTSTEVCCFNEIVKDYYESAEFTQIRSEFPEVEIQLELAADLLNIHGSPPHLSKVIMNVLQNALEATEGSGTIRLSTFNRYLDIPFCGYETVEEGEYVCCSVQDQGTGIEPDDLKRIFEPFLYQEISWQKRHRSRHVDNLDDHQGSQRIYRR